MKRKSLTMILCLLTCLSLVGVGFAAWVISAGDKEVVTGNIVVDTVTDNRIELTVTPVSGKDIILNGPAGAATGWLTYSGSQTEQLKVSFKCVVAYKSGQTFTDASVLETPTATLAEPTGNTAYDKAKTNKCFALASGTVDTLAFTDGVNVSGLTVEDGKVVFTVTVAYVWGEIFGNDNPFTFYNAKDVSTDCGDAVNSNESATWGDHAAYYLGLLDAVDTGSVAYNLTIQVDFK